ncbi:MAG: hypothetical protein KGL53_06370 [Elusimicrobia bacterium]|nr:hypothetical protein [Elusimicrobiota bacterium]
MSQRTPLPRMTLAAVLGLALASAAQAAPHGVFWAQGRRPTRSASGGGLLYYGGPVISHAKVYAVFWGDNVDPETKAKIGPFFANMLDSGYMDWLKEYQTGITAVDGRRGTGQTIGRGRFMGALTIHPKNAATDLSDADIQTELDGQIAAGKLPPSDGDTLYMVYFPSGVGVSVGGMASCSSFCAYHEGFKSARSGAPVYYGVMPVCGWGCGFGGSAFDSLSIVSSHEATEAVTDPFPTPGSSPAYPQAWNSSDGQEIGDLCADGSSTVTGRGLTSAVQWEWDNSIDACAKGPWTQSLTAAAPRRLPLPVTFRLLDSLREPTLWRGR